MMVRWPAKSLWLFLGLVVGVGAAFGHVLEGAAFAVFFLFISSIDHKPAFKALFDPPGDQDSGRSAGRFLFGRFSGAMSPREQLRMPYYTNRRSK
jgi:hypothetical protein